MDNIKKIKLVKTIHDDTTMIDATMIDTIFKIRDSELKKMLKKIDKQSDEIRSLGNRWL